MPTEEQFIADIVATPDDDIPRLKYAKWLEARGDAERSEFIHIQCALASDEMTEVDRVALQGAERELLARCGWKWAEEFGLTFEDWVFQRGFIERATICLERPAEEILSLLQRTPLRHLRDTTQFCDLDGLVNALPHLNQLTGLELWNIYDVVNDQMQEILQSPHLSNLCTLILHHDRNGNLIDEEVIIAGLRSPTRERLEELAVNVDCSWQGPSNAILHAIADSPYLRNLKRLNLSNAGDTGNNPELTVDSIERLARSPNLANLEVLDLRAVHATADCWRAILAMPQLPKLKKLYLNNACEVGDPWIPIIGYVANMPWREQFASLVSDIDWETRFIDPWSGECWQGMSWASRRQQALFEMHRFIRAGDFDGLEAEYRRKCMELSDTSTTNRVDRVSFENWSRAVRTALSEILGDVPKNAGAAIVLRIRPDVEWMGEIGVHEQFAPVDGKGHEIDLDKPFEEMSYGPPEVEHETPRVEEAGAIFMEFYPSKSIRPSGPALYLLARSIAEFGRGVRAQHPPVPVFFSCMWAVFRIA